MKIARLNSFNKMDYSKITLGEMLSSPNEAIKRNAIGIMKQYQKCGHDKRDLVFSRHSEYTDFIRWDVKCPSCGIGWLENTKK